MRFRRRERQPFPLANEIRWANVYDAPAPDCNEQHRVGGREITTQLRANYNDWEFQNASRCICF